MAIFYPSHVTDFHGSEGEANFVVFHPSKGVLSIEVKAGDIGYRGGNWIQTNRHTAVPANSCKAWQGLPSPISPLSHSRIMPVRRRKLTKKHS